MGYTFKRDFSCMDLESLKELAGSWVFIPKEIQ